MTRIVIHRNRTFDHAGRRFRVTGSRGSDPANPGWGYAAEDIRTGQQVGEDYTDLSDLRARAADDIAAWQQSHSISAYADTREVRCSCGWERQLPTLEQALAAADGHHPEARWRT